MEDLTLVIPAKNEKESLPAVLNELKEYNVSIIIVLEKNDVETIDSVKNFKCNLVYQKINGYGAALIEGINNVKTQYFCIFNADGSFDPKELSDMQKNSYIQNLILFLQAAMKKIVVVMMIQLSLILEILFLLKLAIFFLI